MLEESSQVAAGWLSVCCVGRADLVVSWLMFCVTLIQPINNLQNYYPGWTGGQGNKMNLNLSQEFQSQHFPELELSGAEDIACRTRKAPHAAAVASRLDILKQQ